MKRALLLVLMALWGFSTPAYAAPYEVDLCANSGASQAWSGANSTPQSLTLSVNCPARARERFDGVVVRTRRDVTSTPSGGTATWSVHAPPGTSITRMQLSRHLGNWQTWRAEIVTAEGTVLDSCSLLNVVYCERGDRTGNGPTNAIAFNNQATSRIDFRVRCVSAGPCANGASTEHAWIAVYAAKVTVEDPTPPTIAPLSGTYGPGWQRGTATAGVSASDASGIRTLRLVAGSRELASTVGACDYTQMQPCQRSLDHTFSFDTAQLPDGTHELKAIATDAADQAAEAVGTIRVDRNAPGAPTDASVTPNSDGTYGLTWTSLDQGTASPVVAAHAAVCDGAAVPTCQPAQRVAVQGGKVELPVGKSTLRVWLEDEAGNTDPTKATTIAVDTSVLRTPRVVDMNPPVLEPSRPAPSSRIKLTRARRSGSTLTLSGTIARGASARITASLARSSTGKTVTTARTTPRRGTWSIRIKLARSMRNTSAMYLTLRFAGQDDFRKTTLKRKLARKRSGGNTAVEFSIETGR